MRVQDDRVTTYIYLCYIVTSSNTLEAQSCHPLWVRAACLRLGIAIYLGLFLILAQAALAGEPLRPQLKLEGLEIVTSSGRHAFSVEVMRSDPQRQRGLMFRRFLPQDRGMLFKFEAEYPLMMWMKNTYVPLDMIFIGRSGKVVGLAEHTEPLSEKVIPSGAPAYGVLEVNAGTAARIGLRIGDTIRHPVFGK
ncbi:MAG: DUF192 domain-containing protein [Beijerinckiaceae bacterium]|nr:DUF192 domain-containing protein [Beijerinckiaceae bacterium]MCI0734854.1 DUF192 domain-containing protein [Beijerinckiaceae bacterium]